MWGEGRDPSAEMGRFCRKDTGGSPPREERKKSSRSEPPLFPGGKRGRGVGGEILRRWKGRVPFVGKGSLLGLNARVRRNARNDLSSEGGGRGAGKPMCRKSFFKKTGRRGENI